MRCGVIDLCLTNVEMMAYSHVKQSQEIYDKNILLKVEKI